MLVALIFAGIILTFTAMRTFPQHASPVPDLISQDATLSLAIKSNTYELDRPDLSGAAGAVASPFFFAPVPVSRAGKSLLMTLPGIGEGLADKIITFRDQHGPITSIEEFAMINGIGAKRIKALQHSLSFE
ncbi:ComEA family DNA-binding protein [Desulfopila aestuarii]|nr:helix-hairpin-helix domain-containing protein [Desulfopila aestuarii]